VFAGFLEHTDHHIGRLLDFLGKTGQLDDTLIMLVSDNGASAEGGPHGSVNENLFLNNVPETAADGLKAIDDLGGPKCFNHYPWGWAWAGNTPFRRWKRETYRGGSSDPFVVHWPKGIKARGEIRTQYAHIIDMLPTVLEALGIEAPTQIRGITEGLTCGRDDGSTVTTDYRGPFAFSGALEKVVVDVSGELIEDHDARLRSTMAHQ
jgi:arylsulfatase